MTNEQLLRLTSKLSRDIAGAAYTLAEGVWNPEFRRADGSYVARLIRNRLEEAVSQIDELITK